MGDPPYIRKRGWAYNTLSCDRMLYKPTHALVQSDSDVARVTVLM